MRRADKTLLQHHREIKLVNKLRKNRRLSHPHNQNYNHKGSLNQESLKAGIPKVENLLRKKQGESQSPRQSSSNAPSSSQKQSGQQSGQQAGKQPGKSSSGKSSGLSRPTSQPGQQGGMSGGSQVAL